MSAVDLLNLTCTITTPSFARGATTSFMVPTYGSGTTGVKCSIQPARTRQGQYGNRETGITEFDVYLEPTATVAVDSRITAIAGVDQYADVWSGKTLCVTSLWADATGRGVYKRVTAQLINDGPTI